VKEISCTNQNPDQGEDMLLKTRIFELCKEEYKNLYELAQVMKVSVIHLDEVHRSKRSINQKFIIGTMRAFPEYNIGDLFYFTS